MKTDRKTLLSGFLARSGWGQATRVDLAGDASMRRYERLRHSSGETAILLDAPRDTNPDVHPFVNIALHLSAIGLSAPQIYQQDRSNGFLL